MSDIRLEPEQKYLCRELNTGNDLNGFYCYSNKSIKAEICSFNECFFINDDVVFLHTENNHIVSLYENIITQPGSSSRNIAPEMRTHKQVILSNIAVIGHDKWEAEDRLKRVSFRIKHMDGIVKNREFFDRLIKSGISDSYDPKIFSVSVNGMNIEIAYSATYSSDFNEPRDIWPCIEIEFENALLLTDYFKYVICIRNFFSLSLGVSLSPSDFNICRFSREEARTQIEKHEYAGDYAVTYLWTESDFCERELWHGGALVTANGHEELQALKECLTIWVSRFENWKKAYGQMMQSLSLAKEISPSRLLAACKWFEEIPLTKSQQAISDEHIKDITGFASVKALEMGYKDLENRIKGSLKSIKTETHEDRFKRLKAMVNDRFNVCLLREGIVTDLMQSLSYRGKCAHGYLGISNEKEFLKFSKATYALEALCFALTAYDLPLCDSNISKLNNHPLIENYRLASK